MPKLWQIKQPSIQEQVKELASVMLRVVSKLYDAAREMNELVARLERLFPEPNSDIPF
jgi:hypothetical protein